MWIAPLTAPNLYLTLSVAGLQLPIPGCVEFALLAEAQQPLNHIIVLSSLNPNKIMQISSR